MSEPQLTSLTVKSPPPQRTIAVRVREGKGPRPVLAGQFKSDMKGTKAQALDAWAQQQGRACLRFDYSGHGESGGNFMDGTIGRWLRKASRFTGNSRKRPQVIVGSSMGGWLALLLARALARVQRRGADRRHGADRAGRGFHGNVDVERFSDPIKREIEEKGFWLRPSAYGEEPYPITKGLIEDGRQYLLLGGMIETGCPVHILQGVQDPDVPWRHASELLSRFSRDDVVLTLIKDGDHRLSRPEDIERLIAAVEAF